MIGMAALLLLAMSCKKKEAEAGGEVRFLASMEAPSDDSKTHLADDGQTVLWDANDAITVVNSNNTALDFTIVNISEDGKTAEFVSNEHGVPEGYFTPGYIYKAYYPASMYDKANGKVSLPREQAYKPGSFYPGCNPMAARSNDEKLSFRNICGLLELQLKGTCTVNTISITSKNTNEMLWGVGNLTMNDGLDSDMVPTLSNLQGGSNSITLKCNNSVTLKTDEVTKFYFVLPAGSLASGFDMLLTDSEGKVWNRSSAVNPEHPTTIAQNKIKRMSVLSVDVKDPVVPVQVNFIPGCISCTYTVSGSVTVPDGDHHCEIGVVCSQTEQTPTLDNCDKQIVVRQLSEDPISGTKNFTVDITSFEEDKKYYVRAYAKIEGVKYSEQTKPVTYSTPKPLPSNWSNGESPYMFSVSPTKKVKFSSGNLQYSAAGAIQSADFTKNVGGTWRFAEHQFDIIGEDNTKAAYNYTGYIDVFGWGTSGYNHNSGWYGELGNCYQPWSRDMTENKYWPYFLEDAGVWAPPYTHNLNPAGIMYHMADWGYNKISNGGNAEGKWRTLSSATIPVEYPEYIEYTLAEFRNTEWGYLVNRQSGSLCNAGYIACKPGLILLPDNWSWENNLVKDLKSIWDGNHEYTYGEWFKMEQAGAVFLPTTGGYNETTPYAGKYDIGIYWASNFDSHYSLGMPFGGVCGIFFTAGSPTGLGSNNSPRNGLAVRLVKDAN